MNDTSKTSSEKSKRTVHYQIVVSEDIDSEVPEELARVYSVLALWEEDGITRTHFVYDIARKKDAATSVLETIRKAAPEISELEDFISDALG